VFAAPQPPENVVGFSGPVARTSEIKIDDYTYAPLRITVTAGTTVTFSNNGAQPHNATSSDGGGFDTGLLSKGEAATVTFNRPGSYTYICTPHPSMIGQIIVTGQAVAEDAATDEYAADERENLKHDGEKVLKRVQIENKMKCEETRRERERE